MSEHIYEDSDLENERYHVIPFGSMREEIVRCRDCKYYERVPEDPGDWCEYWTDCVYGADGFCAWGRKERWQMSEIKALNELREYAEQCCPEYEDYDARIMEIADAIESEIAERFMELPVDAIGIPIRVGDKLIYMSPDGQELDCTVPPLTIYEPTRYRHADPRTLEDVLQDAMRYGRVYTIEGERTKAQIAQYIAEIRSIMENDMS